MNAYEWLVQIQHLTKSRHFKAIVKHLLAHLSHKEPTAFEIVINHSAYFISIMREVKASETLRARAVLGRSGFFATLMERTISVGSERTFDNFIAAVFLQQHASFSMRCDGRPAAVVRLG